MGKAKPPKFDALVLCRSIGTDEQRTRWDLHDVIRGRLESEDFPLRLPNLGVYLAMTGMQGEYDVAIEVAELATDKVLAGTRTNDPMRVHDPLAVVAECILLPVIVFENRGRHVCRLLVNGDLVHETTFEVDWPKPPHVKGKMSPQSFARVIERLKAKEPGLDDERLGGLCGVEPTVLVKMQQTFEGLDPEQGNDILARLCHHFRLRPEEFLERDG